MDRKDGAYHRILDCSSVPRQSLRKLELAAVRHGDIDEEVAEPLRGAGQQRLQGCLEKGTGDPTDVEARVRGRRQPHRLTEHACVVSSPTWAASNCPK